jgi:hypothetical protein
MSKLRSLTYREVITQFEFDRLLKEATKSGEPNF